MSSSPVVSTSPTGLPNPAHCEMELGSPVDIFAKQSVQDEAPHVSNRPCCDSDDQIMGDVNSNQPGEHVLTALERRFMMKNLLKRSEADLSLVDVRQGKDIFKRGIQNMSDATVSAAIVAKRADVESKRLWALAAAWELESTEKHAILFHAISRDNADQYVENKGLRILPHHCRIRAAPYTTSVLYAYIICLRRPQRS